MCGIAGVISFDGSPINGRTLTEMGNRLTHRGPDAGDIWYSPKHNVGFSHRRLSIIDLAGSPQPLTSNSGKTTVCFNGEIFNYKELRQKWNYEYKTNGDTETLLSGFESESEEFVDKLRGQFAFAIYNKDSDEVTLYRDRLGILPLYYYSDSKIFAFASEIKSLLVALGSMPEIDKKSISNYLAQRAVPAPYTMYENIKKLEPGSKLTVSTNGEIHQEYWYRINPINQTNFSHTYEESVKQLENLLSDSVEAALVADVPVGAYLSGGIDSSLICAMISKIRGKDNASLSTFSAKFTDGTSLDETPFARTVSKLLNTDHHEVSVTPQDFIDTWPKLSYQFDAPIPEPPDIAFSFLAELARKHVTVVLSGEGSDELFGGYPKYQYAKLVDSLSKLPSTLRVPTFRLIEKSLPASMNRQRTFIRAASQNSELESFRTWFAPFTKSERKDIFDYEEHDILARTLTNAEGDVTSRMSYLDLHSWLSDNILERGDRTSMMHSLELRPPFLDVKVLEFARSLPSEFLVDKKTSKKIVRDVAKSYLPQEIFERNKHGFKVPLDDWFRGHLRDFAYDHLTSNGSISRQLFDSKFVDNLLTNHMKEKYNDGMRIYTLVALEMWYRNRAAI